MPTGDRAVCRTRWLWVSCIFYTVEMFSLTHVCHLAERQRSLSLSLRDRLSPDCSSTSQPHIPGSESSSPCTFTAEHVRDISTQECTLSPNSEETNRTEGTSELMYWNVPKLSLQACRSFWFGWMRIKRNICYFRSRFGISHLTEILLSLFQRVTFPGIFYYMQCSINDPRARKRRSLRTPSLPRYLRCVVEMLRSSSPRNTDAADLRQVQRESFE